MKLKELFEAKNHGENWYERFQRAEDVTGGPSNTYNVDSEPYYYKHKMYEDSEYELWYFADHAPTAERTPMDLSKLHDDPEVQQQLRAKYPEKKLPVKLEEIEAFIVFHENHSYSAWKTGEGETFAMIDWEATPIPLSSWYHVEDNVFQRMDEIQWKTEPDVHLLDTYIELVKEAVHG